MSALRTRLPSLLAAVAALALVLAPAFADARAGGGSSFGSRGSRTWSAPQTTNTAPYTAAPFERSITPSAPAPTYGNPGYGFGGAPAYRSGGFASGLMGGLIGAGIGGLLFGNGLFGGLTGFGSVFGLLLQLLLLYLLARWVLRMVFSRQPAMAGGPGLFARMGMPQPGPRPVSGASIAPPRPREGVGIGPADYQAFEQTLKAVQDAWSRQDVAALQRVATPEMASYFGEQLAEQSSRGVRNTVTDVRLLQGDLSESWAERGREYATVAMRFTMVDVTRDASGRIVDGSPDEHVTATEIWTFLRAPGGRWMLSAIQQTRG